MMMVAGLWEMHCELMTTTMTTTADIRHPDIRGGQWMQKCKNCKHANPKRNNFRTAIL